jgi:DNA sulfur modification protein DndC
MFDGFSIVRNESFNVLDKYVGNLNKVAVAYSGGKDSTALALLLLDWVSERGRSDLDIVLVHSDTLSEIPEMEFWAKRFMEVYRDYAKKSVGVEADFIVTKPKPIDTFFWRVLVRGYVAPTFSFRWCVELLKRKPSKEALSRASNIPILLGHRDDESSFRVSTLARRGVVCPLTAGGCGAYYYNVDENNTKVYPMRSWTAVHVWDYLRLWRTKIGYLDKLFQLYLYGALPARYGCWHCTLIKKQMAHYILGKNYRYLEAARIIFRWLSDLTWMRIPKDKGYSRLGPLTPAARAIMARLIQVTENLSGIKFYGLDESEVEGYSLRQIFFDISPQDANNLVQRIEQRHIKRSSWRFTDIESIRNIGKHKECVLRFVEHVNEKAKHVDEEVREYIATVINSVVE